MSIDPDEADILVEPAVAEVLAWTCGTAPRKGGPTRWHGADPVLLRNVRLMAAGQRHRTVHDFIDTPRGSVTTGSAYCREGPTSSDDVTVFMHHGADCLGPYRFRMRQTCSDGKRLAQSAVTVPFVPVAEEGAFTST